MLALLKHDAHITGVNDKSEVEYWKLFKALYHGEQRGCEGLKTLYGIMNTFGMHQCSGNEETSTNWTNSIIKGTNLNELHLQKIFWIPPNEQSRNEWNCRESLG